MTYNESLSTLGVYGFFPLREGRELANKTCAPCVWWPEPSGVRRELLESLGPRGAVSRVEDRSDVSTPAEPYSLGSMWYDEHVAMMAVEAGRWRPDLVLVFVYPVSVLWWIFQAEVACHSSD